MMKYYIVRSFKKIPTNDRGTGVEVTLLIEFEEVVAQAAGEPKTIKITIFTTLLIQ